MQLCGRMDKWQSRNCSQRAGTVMTHRALHYDLPTRADFVGIFEGQSYNSFLRRIQRSWEVDWWGSEGRSSYQPTEYSVRCEAPYRKEILWCECSKWHEVLAIHRETWSFRQSCYWRWTYISEPPVLWLFLWAFISPCCVICVAGPEWHHQI